MKFQVVLLEALFCLAAEAGDRPSQVAHMRLAEARV